MGGIFTFPERAQPIAPNGRILECDRCSTPAVVGVRCTWCQDFPEIDKKGKFLKEANAPLPNILSITDIAAHVCQSDSCTLDDDDFVVAVGICTWCRAIKPQRGF